MRKPILALFVLWTSVFGGIVEAQTCGVSNNIGGVAYGDFNSNGINDETNAGISAVRVIAIDNNGDTLATTTTDQDGNYLLLIPNGTTVRLEFTNIPFGYHPSFVGANNGTTVQFVTSPSCTADLGLTHGEDYCEADPYIATGCYVDGEQLTGPYSSYDAFVRFNYSNSGTAPTPDALTTAQNIGTTWGVAYDKEADYLFTAAVLKRHSGFGPMGIGGIYAFQNAAQAGPTLSQYLDLSGCTVLGAVNRPDLATTPATPSLDIEAYQNAGKMGLGDIEVSTDGTTLYVVNLNSKELIRIAIRDAVGDPIKTGLTCADVATTAIPVPCGAASDSRPWALKFHRGTLYVGVVCSAQSSDDVNDLSAHVYAFDPVTNTFNATPILDYPLNYTKGCTDAFPHGDCGWNTWNDNFRNEADPARLQIKVAAYAQPILSDIEFDIDNSMILGFLDRTAFQSGNLNDYNGRLMYGLPGGDIRYVYYDNAAGVYVPESNGNIIDNAGNIVRSGCGISADTGLEFYCGDMAYNHPEHTWGALALKKGTGEVVTNALDPSNIIGSGGIRKISNLTGQETTSYSVYDHNVGYDGKSVGLGDLELLCGIAPIQIGNYLWYDINDNGIQDAQESGIAGIEVQLLDDTGAFLATTTTDANGQYYFSSTTTPALQDSTDYYILIPNYTTVLTGTSFFLTDSNIGNDLTDNDGIISTSGVPASVLNLPHHFITTGDWGENNHSYDFGFTGCFITASYSINTCTIDADTLSSDISINVEWLNFTIGDTLEVSVGINAEMYIITAENSSYTFLLQNAPKSGIILIQNLNDNTCMSNLPYAVPDYLLINNLTVAACTFDVPSLSSRNQVSFDVDWNGLNVGDVLDLEVDGQSDTYTVTTTSGSQTFSYDKEADSSTGNIIRVSSPQNACAFDTLQYTNQAPCPECVLSVTDFTVGACSEPSTGQYQSDLIVEFFWYQQPAGQDIIVTIDTTGGTYSRTYTPAATSGTDTLHFTVPADGAVNLNIDLSWSGGGACNIINDTYDARPACPSGQKNDVALTKDIDNNIVYPGDTINYTIILTNQGDTISTGIDVVDVLPADVSYSSHSVTRGIVVVGANITWTLDTLFIEDTLIIEVIVDAGAGGVYFNEAQVDVMNETDIDSTPGNDEEDEDDIAKVCHTVPIGLCDLDTVIAVADTGLFNYEWYIDTGGGATLMAGETDTTLTITAAGTYTFSATSNLVGGDTLNSCCPVIVYDSTCVCELAVLDVSIINCVLDPALQDSADMFVTIQWQDGTAGQVLSVDIGGTAQTINIPDSVGTQIFTFRVPTDGSTGTITADLNGGACNTTAPYTAPDVCPSCTLNLSGLVVGACNSPANTHSLDFTVNWTDAAIGDTIEVLAGGNLQQIPITSTSGSQAVSLTGVATGMTENIVAQLTGTFGCNTTTTYTSPAPCLPCELNISGISVTGCDFSTGNSEYAIQVGVNWEYVTPADVLEILLDGVLQASTINVTSSDSGAVFLINNLTSDGAAHTVDVRFQGGANSTCTSTANYTAPDACPLCDLQIIDTIMTNCRYDFSAATDSITLTVDFTYANGADDGSITVLVRDSIFQIYRYGATTTGASSLTFELPASDSTTSVEAFFSAGYRNCYDSLGVESSLFCIPYDWGDAPDTYLTDSTGSLGPSHILREGLFMGAYVDAEGDGHPVLNGADALGDDQADSTVVVGTQGGLTDDEDGINSFAMLLDNATTYSVDVTVTDTTGSDAILIGWIDFDGSGTFEADEADSIRISNGTVGGNATLNWTIPADITTGLTYSRFRLTTDTMNINRSTPGGSAIDGEVEDYELLIKSCPNIMLAAIPDSLCVNDSSLLTLQFETAGGDIALYQSTTRLDSATVVGAGHGGATLLDSTITGVVINEVHYTASDTVELWNNGCETVDISAWWLCSGFAYDALNTMTIVSGDLSLSPDEKVVLTGFATITMGAAADLGLYNTGGSFASPTAMEDFIQWGASGLGRESVADAKGIWLAGDFITSATGSNSLQYDGYGNTVVDWAESGTTLGSDNSNLTIPLTSTFSTGPLANATSSPITYYYYAILTDGNCLLGNTCAPWAIDSVVVNPQPAITGRDTSICNGQSIDLSTLITGTPVSTLEYGTSFGTYGTSNPVTPASTTTYFVRDSLANGGCLDTAVIIVTLLNCDWGDLPDTSATTNIDDYQTTNSNNGPVHVIIPGLHLGISVDGETDGQPSADALGDGLDENGLEIWPSLDLAPGNNFRLPFSYTNTTPDTAHVEAWIDWNGDGDFDDAGEMVVDTNDGAGTTPLANVLSFSIPSTAATNTLLGLRIRISHQDNMTPYGMQPNGEIEDYLIGIDCPQVCFSVTATIRRN